MNLKEEIEATFGPHALLRPTFYRNPGGLRFELSTGSSAVEQFLTAHRKAGSICRDVFEAEQTFTVCLSVHCWKPAVAYRSDLRDLKRAGIRIPRDRCLWAVVEGEDVDDEPTKLLHVAFVAERALLDNFLWCALAVDLGIEPCPGSISIRLISKARSVLVHPYDDRGMDVVGPNRELLSNLYSKFESELLDHDRAIMAATFKCGPLPG